MDTVDSAAPENLRLLLGLKLRSLRDRQGWTLNELARRAGVAVSYLSEIEKGKKYPKPEKLQTLARALGVRYEDLVSNRPDDDLAALSAFAESEFLREFPFHLFGLQAADLLELIAGDPPRAGALVRTFGEIALRHDVEVEQLLFAALRSYQQMHHNSFPELEDAAERCRGELGWSERERFDAAELQSVLESRFGYRVDDATLAGQPELSGLRSVFAPGAVPRLYLNSRLAARQRAFVLAREIGFRVLELRARPLTSSWLKAESFDQVLNNFRASTFAGALLMPRRAVVEGLDRFFAAPRFERRTLLDMLRRFSASPEMLLYRISQIVPQAYGLTDLYFVRFFCGRRGERLRLDKVFNLTRFQVPYGVGPDENPCRRWPGVALLGSPNTVAGASLEQPAVEARICRFQSAPAEFFVVAMARPLLVREKTLSSVSLGFLVDDRLRAVARFLGAPGLRRIKVDLTCERCPLAPAACGDRAAPARVLERHRELERRETALAELLARAPSPARSAGDARRDSVE